MEAVLVEMRSRLHHPQDGGERLEVSVLRGDQWVFFEERPDHRHQVAASLYGETKQRVVMVVVASVLDDLPAPEHLLEEFERRPRRRRLGNRELVLDLPAEEAPGVAHDRDREAAFAVDEADDPLLEPWPFLLIARTGRVVTGHGRTLQRGWDSQYRRILGVSSI